MKITKFLLAAFVVSTMASCSVQETPTGDDKEAAKITLTLEGADTKSVDNVKVDEDKAVNDLIVFVVRNDAAETIDKIVSVTKAQIASNKFTINATSKAHKVYIVTNTGHATSTPAFANNPLLTVSTMVQARKVAASLDGTTTNACVSKNVWMAGENGLTLASTDADGKKHFTTTVKLNYIAAKIHVIVKNEMENFNEGNVILNGVAVANGGAWTGFFRDGTKAAGKEYMPARADLTSTDKVPFFYNGIDLATDELAGNYFDAPAKVGGKTDYATKSFLKWTGPAGVGFPMDKTTVLPKTVTPTATEGFYVFPNITTNETHVGIYGKFDNKGEGKADVQGINYYWSFHFNGSDGKAGSIQSGHKYIITITLKGKANPGGGGEPDITIDDPGSDVLITIEEAEWIPEMIDKVIQ